MPIDALAGTPLEVQKRKAVVPLLYVMSFLWLAQTVLAGKHAAHTVSSLPISACIAACTTCFRVYLMCIL